MKALPIKFQHFRKTDNVYYIGVDGVFTPDTDAVHAATVLMKKVMQIKAYCAKYNKPVFALINSTRVPRYIHTALSALRIKLISVVEKDVDAKYGDYYQVEDPMVFIAMNSDVVLFLQPEVVDDDQDIDVDLGEVETPQVYLKYKRASDVVPMLTNPNEVVQNFKQPKIINSDPYMAFYHEPLFRRVPYNYWQEIMETLPDTKGLGMGMPNNVW